MKINMKKTLRNTVLTGSALVGVLGCESANPKPGAGVYYPTVEEQVQKDVQSYFIMQSLNTLIENRGFPK